MSNSIRCSVCNAFVPAAESVVGKVVGGAIASALGVAKTKHVGGLAFGLIGILAGHVVDAGIERMVRPVCGDCQGFQPA